MTLVNIYIRKIVVWSRWESLFCVDDDVEYLNVEHVCDRVCSQHCIELCQGTRGRDCVVFSAGSTYSCFESGPGQP